MLKDIPPFSTTGIGSLPHIDPGEAVRLVLDTFDMPFWPQLPKASFREQMIPQYSEGIPFVRVDEQKEKIWLETTDSDELERFYESYKEDSLIAISGLYARGVEPFLKAVSGRGFKFLKGHVTGPLTFTLGLMDDKGRAVYYDEELREICLMALKAKIRWQAHILKPHAGAGVVIFIDEPILSALGSTAYMGVAKAEALRLLGEAVGAVKAAGALSGIHCCGRAEWPLLIDAGTDIINFDAYGFGDTLSIYPDEIRDFMDKGGMLAWGIVPTTEAINTETGEGLKRVFYRMLEALSRHIPEEKLRENILLTPSCGAGSRSIEETLKVFQLLMRLKEDILS